MLRPIGMTGRRAGSLVLVLVALLAATTGCTGSNDPAPSPPDSRHTPPATSSPADRPAWSMDDVRIDRIPADPPMVDSALPASFPPDDAVLPDLLEGPPGRARLAYHPRETFDDRDGWSDERVFFFGVDGTWRSLELVDLGLPESDHPGVDTYGAGELSPDGTRWAAKTNAGVVVVNLGTGLARMIELPGRATNYLDWRPDGRRLDVARFGGRPRYRTWTVDPASGRTKRAPYSLPLDGYAVDGAVVTYEKRGIDVVRTAHRGRRTVSGIVPIPWQLVRLGGLVGETRTMVGLRRNVAVVDTASSRPLARVRLGYSGGFGFPRGWLDEDTLYFYSADVGLLTWDVETGDFRLLTSVRPAARKDSYWTTSVAEQLVFD